MPPNGEPNAGARFADSQGPPGDWTRRVGESLVDGSAFEALREHLADGETQCLEWCPVCRAADLVRASAGPELREHWSLVQREALLALRALIDHYLEQPGDGPSGRGPRVEDIAVE